MTKEEKEIWLKIFNSICLLYSGDTNGDSNNVDHNDVKNKADKIYKELMN